MPTFTDTFARHVLGPGHEFYVGQLPQNLMVSDAQFDELWKLHPTGYLTIMLHGRSVRTPRWQQAFGMDYHYSGQLNKALPTPVTLQPLLEWTREHICADLNGVLLNWYDGTLGHYIGAHRDSTVGIVAGTPIVTLSFGEDRKFRLRPWKGRGFIDFFAKHGIVFVMPSQTNQAYTHEVPHPLRSKGRRISLTFRAFEP